MNIRNLLIAAAVAVAPVLACAEEQEATPPEIPIAIDFQSAAIAVAVENVQIFAYKDLELDCTALIEGRRAQQPPPASAAETRALTPCDLFQNNGNAISLDLNSNYTMFAVAQVAGQDVLVGCTKQPAYGTTTGLEITLSFIDDRQQIPPQTCTKLSDKCNRICQ